MYAQREVGAAVATDIFGSIRCLAPFRLTGGTKGELPYVPSVFYCHLHRGSLDYKVVGSDLGRIATLYYDLKTSSFIELQQETYGKSGSRRTVPGQFMTTDSKGRNRP